MWQGLLANLASVAMIILLWTNLRVRCERWGSIPSALAFGSVMGAGSVLAMCLSFELFPGFIYDLRGAPIAIAGLFGGPVVAGLAMTPAVLYRVWLGGMGVAPGCASISAIAVTAALCHRFFSPASANAYRLAAMAALVACAGALAGWACTPSAFAKTADFRTMAPLLVMNVLGIYLGCLALLQEEQRRKLAARNALYRAVIEALPDCLNVKDNQGRFIVANPATARLMGAKSAQDLIGKTDFDFFPEVTARDFRAEEERVLHLEKTPKTFEQRATFQDGAAAWLSTLKAPFFDERGELVGLITHNRDITESKRLQLQLQETQLHLASALANMADGLVVYDGEGRIVLCNAQYRSLFPLTSDLRVKGALLPDILRAAVARGEEEAPQDGDLDALIARILHNLRNGGDRLIAMKDGRYLEARTRPSSDGGALTIFSDVTERKRMERELQFRAEHDPLTRLANRAAFHERLSQAFERSRMAQSEVALIAVDLDHFKQINDTYGHQVGDELLEEVARRLRCACRPNDLVARLGGDEFVIICEGPELAAKQSDLGQRVVESVSAPFSCKGAIFQPSCSAGVALSPSDATTPETLIASADMALYAAKNRGRRTWAVYRDLGASLKLAS